MVNLFSLIQDYLVDQEDEIRQLITWFLNLEMEEETLLQSGAERYEKTDSRKASRNGYKPDSLNQIWRIRIIKASIHGFPFERKRVVSVSY